MDALEASEDRSILFENVLGEGPPSRARVVMTLLAVLELARIQVLQIYQHADQRGTPQGPIRVRLSASATEPELPEPESAAEPGDIANGS
jgi:chromatin segregation and condensation protein Rec8/ScpA/Scc1 (kleisin family)